MSLQFITRKGTFDAGHRVMNEKMKCFNLHGHTYLYDLTFSFDNSRAIGYPVDFKEIKRVGCEWIERYLDHGFIANPKDEKVIAVVNQLENKLWEMSLNGKGEYCNPTAENIAKELFIAMDIISSKWQKGLQMHELKLWETPNCCTTCIRDSYTFEERVNFEATRYQSIWMYMSDMGSIDYDDRAE